MSLSNAFFKIQKNIMACNVYFQKKEYAGMMLNIRSFVWALSRSTSTQLNPYYLRSLLIHIRVAAQERILFIWRQSIPFHSYLLSFSVFLSFFLMSFFISVLQPRYHISFSYVSLASSWLKEFFTFLIIGDLESPEEYWWDIFVARPSIVICW